jgi:pyruvate/2-oxoglutarate dehydrogenase complex dihydrolipoamide dehydrogenase (E3) component
MQTRINYMDNQHRTIVSNVLVIGSGSAGLRAAIAAYQAGVKDCGRQEPAPGCTYCACFRRH